MSTLARNKYEAILEVIARESEEKNRKRSYTRATKKAAKAREKELMFEFNTAIRKVHKKSLSNRKPKAYEPTLHEALADFYAEF